ncbi:SCP2 sterol-binding domain-containing protein [Rhodococcus ruber]|jgi:putative sterol carrier protein|uniref:Sterol carrier protein n=2 Tax=Rhodococcus TaxID=1827 RepID=A0A2S2C864_9NOCA|nr:MULTISPECIES: SCP2 sterol-binding domain-containing protein [Rhodococcus]AWK77008.1 sterol carrier protein [Rhodococcus oxybenzonivorans]MCD2130068.1 SCP2 sterol-binding domain-containing protein [Rhodococcus ruber]MCZ4506534.1 SCP2 sterol-binding domain-containing protein [Rhodococcus ruber]MCZ4533759.1 SCP2 sterol-binding domain-containing protein [Rhodococcus ruber]MCZ4623997.1 SCP2 sterol-binding domain-containing protein [Rhodococcus ruber]
MGVFKNDDDVYKYVGGVFTQGVADPELGPKFAESGVTLRITYTDPDSVITVDFPNGKVYTGAGVGPDPNVELFMSADNGNKFWLGNLNLPVAMAKGTVRAKGPVPKLLKLIPAAKTLFDPYRKMLAADERADLLNA